MKIFCPSFGKSDSWRGKNGSGTEIRVYKTKQIQLFHLKESRSERWINCFISHLNIYTFKGTPFRGWCQFEIALFGTAGAPVVIRGMGYPYTTTFTLRPKKQYSNYHSSALTTQQFIYIGIYATCKHCKQSKAQCWYFGDLEWVLSELLCCLCQIGFNKNIGQALSRKQTKCLQKLKIQNNELFLAKFVWTGLLSKLSFKVLRQGLLRFWDCLRHIIKVDWC